MQTPIDYVRTSGAGIDPLILNQAQTRRRGRGWWRMLLDQYGAADIAIAEVDVRRAFPGGPALATFTARFGPDAQVLGRFQLRAQNSEEMSRMLDEGVRRMDMVYRRALEAGLLQPDPSLVIIAPAVQQVIEEEAEADPEADTPTPAAGGNSFSVQVDTPDAAAVQSAEVSVRPGRRRHLGDHHQPRARRHVGDSGEFYRRRGGAAGGATRPGLERHRRRRLDASHLALTA